LRSHCSTFVVLAGYDETALPRSACGPCQFCAPLAARSTLPEEVLRKLLNHLCGLGYAGWQMKIFLGSATADRKWAERLREHLVAAGLDVWDPNHEVLPGDDWSAKIGAGLRNADAMVVLVSPQAAESDAVQREIEYAIGAKLYARRLIPVIVRPTSKLPWILERLQAVRLNDDPARATREIVKLLRLHAKSDKPAPRAAAH
jgi:hypothetical protein